MRLSLAGFQGVLRGVPVFVGKQKEPDLLSSDGAS